MEEGKQVGTVTAVTLFPVKSCRGIPLEEGFCGYQGLCTTDETPTRDRHFMVVYPDGRMCTLKKEAKMALITPSIHGDHIKLQAPGTHTLILPMNRPNRDEKVITCTVLGDKVDGVDCGEDAAGWISQCLGKPCRIVHSPDHLPKRVLKDGYFKGDRCAENLKHEDQVAYQSDLPYLLTGTASLDDINSKVKQKVTMTSFRPNIEVDTEVAFEEDQWKTISIGTATFRNVKLCNRCLVTTVDPEAGVFHPDQQPWKTLRSYRIIPEVSKYSPCFGVNLTVVTPGNVKVGDPVYIK